MNNLQHELVAQILLRMNSQKRKFHFSTILIRPDPPSVAKYRVGHGLNSPVVQQHPCEIIYAWYDYSLTGIVIAAA